MHALGARSAVERREASLSRAEKLAAPEVLTFGGLAEEHESLREAEQDEFARGSAGYAARKLDQSAARKVVHSKGGSFYALLI
jgi:hypothetical protein